MCALIRSSEMGSFGCFSTVWSTAEPGSYKHQGDVLKCPYFLGVRIKRDNFRENIRASH